MKKILSLTLALVMCLGLTVPTFAVKVGDTTVTDANGEVYELSSPILMIVQLPKGYLKDLPENAPTIAYIVAEGTTIHYSDYDTCLLTSEGFQISESCTYTTTGNFYYPFVTGFNSNSIGEWTIFTSEFADEAVQGPTKPAQSATAMPTNDKLTSDGVVQNPTVYKINGSNYFKIRDLAAVLNGTEKQFEVGYDGTTKSVTATTGKGYAKGSGDLAGAASSNEAATVSNDTIYVDGKKVEAEVYKIGGNNYFKLRDLGRALDFYVGYEKGEGMFIDTTKPYSE